MQCTRCGQPLQAGVLFCRACGEPVVGSAPVVVSDGLAGEETGAADLAANPGTLGYTGFAFQEFRDAPAPGQPITPLPPEMPGAGQPMPGMPWQGMLLPGQPGAGMYAPYPPGAPGYPFYPVQAAPTKPKNLWTSVGCIISYVVLAVLLVFVGLGVGLYEFGSHLSSNSVSQKTAAMKLYSQVTSQTPDFNDPMTSASDTNWYVYTKSTYGCALQADGLHVHISDTNHFAYCLASIGDRDNFAVQVQMRVLSGDNGGLIFRANDDGASFYYFEMNESGSYRIFIDKNVATTPTYLSNGTTEDVNPPPGQTNTLTLIAKGSTFDFYVNGQYITQVQDATYQSGALGMIASDVGAPTEILYTNAKIWEL